MSKIGNFVLEVEEFVQELFDSNINDERIFDLVKSVHGSFGLSIAQDYLDRARGIEYDRSPV